MASPEALKSKSTTALYKSAHPARNRAHPGGPSNKSLKKQKKVTKVKRKNIFPPAAKQIKNEKVLQHYTEPRQKYYSAIYCLLKISLCT